MADKVFKTYREQRELLISRGMIIKSPAKFYAAMKQDDYYTIINGYKKYFIATFDPDEEYISGTTFTHIYSLYIFDQQIRSLIFPALLTVEKNIKSIIAYQFSSVYGHNHNQFLNTVNFKNDKRNQRHTRQTLNKIRSSISYYQNHNHDSIVHYMTQYGYAPLWVINSILTFGEIAHFYDCLKLPDQQNISSCFNMAASTLDGAIFLLADYRNTCAHGSRLYTTNTSPGHRHHLPDTVYHRRMGIPQNSSGNYRHGKTDLLALLIALKLFLPQQSFKKLAKSFTAKEARLAKILPVSIMRNIDYEMGQPMIYLPLLANL